MLVQTLYGHAGTVTGVFVYGSHIISSSTDKHIKAWKQVEGREHLAYPWFDLQVNPCMKACMRPRIHDILYRVLTIFSAHGTCIIAYINMRSTTCTFHYLGHQAHMPPANLNPHLLPMACLPAFPHTGYSCHVGWLGALTCVWPHCPGMRITLW